jgi:epsilon-lactone hydrolase
MKSETLAQLVAGLRAGGPDLGAPPPQARASFSAMVEAAPIAADVQFERIDLGGVPALASTTPGTRADQILMYLHGGAFVVGSAHDYRSLSCELGRATGVRAVSVDYALAPEHPFPAAVDSCVAAYRALLDGGLSPRNIVIAGDSAGGGLTLSTLLAARDAGLPLPAAALCISPWVDLECSGGSSRSKADVDPSLKREGLLYMAGQYLQGQAASHPLASPLQADLRGLPPLLVQVGSAEILLDDALRLAQVAAHADVPVQLAVWPDMVHVWHFFSFMLPEGRQALAEAGAFLRHHLG